MKFHSFRLTLLACVWILGSADLLAQDTPQALGNADAPKSPSLQAQATDQNSESNYDAELAKQLGADEYGMKAYVLVVLTTGKVKVEDQDQSRKIFAGHFSNMNRLAKEGKLVLAGPFLEGAPKRGLFILNVTTLEDAEKLVKSDPAVQAGVFDYELTKLYCSAALMKINELHATIQKTKIQ